jgi:DNA-binding PadR family transcriptional regulator
MSDPYIPSKDLLALTILALLAEQPMHPYQMQRLTHERHKDFAISKIRTLYNTVDRLQQAGLIEPAETSREGKRPERTVYRLTSDGRDEFFQWLKELISTPVPELPVFSAAISFLAHLPMADALSALQMRSALLEGAIGTLDGYLHGLTVQLPRIVLLESEYMRTLHQAELEWTRSLIEDIRSGKLAWDADQYHRQSAPGETGSASTSAEKE